MMGKKKSLLTQIPGFKKSRKYPIKYDEYGRSARRQAFQLFSQGHRPMQIYKTDLIPVPLKTLFRYYEDWKKQKHKIPYSTLRRYMKESPEFSERFIGILADYFDVSDEEITLRIQRPWGLSSLSKGELPDRRLYRIQSEIESRLEAALRFIYLWERIHQNSPKQIRRFILQILGLKDDY